MESKSGQPVANSQAVVVAPTNVAGLATTISAAAEQAARAAVGEHNNSSMVVIQPSTGKILAVANNAGFNDFALTAAVAPGSTMKTLTSTALFNEGALSPASHVACPETFTIQGITYHNDKGESESASTPFITDFAQSCNNALYAMAASDQRSPRRRQSSTITAWTSNGTSASAAWPRTTSTPRRQHRAPNSPKKPSARVADRFAAGHGVHRRHHRHRHFPAAVPGSGGSAVTATPLPATTDAWLKEMMRAVVTSGTAAPSGSARMSTPRPAPPTSTARASPTAGSSPSTRPGTSQPPAW